MTGRIALEETTLAEEQRKIAQCDEQFAALVHKQSRFVFHVAYAALRNSHDAEDVTQEVFLKLYRTDAWHHMREERAYLARMAWRAATDRRNKAQNEPLSENSASTEQSPEAAAVEADWSAVVHRLIDALPEDLRVPLALSAIDELTSGEIAKTLRIPEGTVRTRLMKGREVLKQKLARYA